MVLCAVLLVLGSEITSGLGVLERLAHLLLTIGVALLFIPIGVLVLECIAALLPRSLLKQSATSAPNSAPDIAVLVPAHNEASGIAPVLQNLQSQLKSHDRLVVIADNCTDDTAAIARSTGAIVLERHNAEQRGKGYALDYGIRALSAQPPEVVVLMDADCFAQPGAVAAIARLAVERDRPVQSIYLMEPPAQSTAARAISALAFLVKNQVRPLGLRQLGMPCLLTGTGMAFPWELIRQAPLASSNLVEDMQLGLDLAIAGTPPLLCPTAQVIGCLPRQEAAAKSQRTRWEHGHLKTLQTQVPRLFKAFLQQRRLDLLALALDLAVPPLSLLVMLWIGFTSLAMGGFLVSGFALPIGLAAVQGVLLLGAIATAWARFGRGAIALSDLVQIPLYILWKVPLYFKFLARPQTGWVRTERD